jgi:hypothetical protein
LAEATLPQWIKNTAHKRGTGVTITIPESKPALRQSGPNATALSAFAISLKSPSTSLRKRWRLRCYRQADMLMTLRILVESDVAITYREHEMSD